MTKFVPELLRRTSLLADTTQDEAATYRYLGKPSEGNVHMLAFVNPLLVPTAEEQEAYRRRGALKLALLLAQQADPQFGDIDDHVYRLEELLAHAGGQA